MNADVLFQRIEETVKSTGLDHRAAIDALVERMTSDPQRRGVLVTQLRPYWDGDRYFAGSVTVELSPGVPSGEIWTTMASETAWQARTNNAAV